MAPTKRRQRKSTSVQNPKKKLAVSASPKTPTTGNANSRKRSAQIEIASEGRGGSQKVKRLTWDKKLEVLEPNEGWDAGFTEVILFFDEPVNKNARLRPNGFLDMEALPEAKTFIETTNALPMNWVPAGFDADKFLNKMVRTVSHHCAVVWCCFTFLKNVSNLMII